MAQLDIWYNLAVAMARSYMALFMESIHVQCYANIPKGPKIIIANHPNATDGFVLPFIFREKLHYLVEEDLFHLPILGKIIKLADRMGFKIRSVDIEEPNLEAVFLQLTGRALRD